MLFVLTWREATVISQRVCNLDSQSSLEKTKQNKRQTINQCNVKKVILKDKKITSNHSFDNS